jgi:hypothetical protein
MAWKSVLKPEGSIVSGVAVVGLVIAIYQTHLGSVAEAYATEDNHPAMASSKNKAGYTAFIAVAGLTLLTRDANVGILGSAAIVASELSYRTAIMTHPQAGFMVPPEASTHQPVASNVVPMAQAASYDESYGS